MSLKCFAKKNNFSMKQLFRELVHDANSTKLYSEFKHFHNFLFGDIKYAVSSSEYTKLIS